MVQFSILDKYKVSSLTISFCWATILCKHASSTWQRQIESPLRLIFMPGTNRATEKRLRNRKGFSWLTAMGSLTNGALFFLSCRTVWQCLTVPDSMREVALQLFISVSSRSCSNRPTFDTVFKWPHQQIDNQWDKEEHLPCQLREGGVIGRSEGCI